jgi:hypothetical protein
MIDETKQPNSIEGSNDKELITKFYQELLQKYPQLTEEVEWDEGILHMDMEALRRLAEELCEKRKLNEVKELFEWLNSYYCCSKDELLNAINVSFLEYFNYKKGLSDEEFKNIMPPNFYKGYLDMIEYMENLAGSPW